MDKPVIVQISAVSPDKHSIAVYGLGKDGLVYVWDRDAGEWRLDKEEPPKTVKIDASFGPKWPEDER